MAPSIIENIKINQANTLAWTKRFAVAEKPQEKSEPRLKWFVRNLDAEDYNHDQILAKAQSLVDIWFQQELLITLSSYIKDQVTGRESLGFTSFAAADASEGPLPTSSWAVKKELHSGTGYIYQDVDAAVAALGESIGLDPSSMRTRNMTLLYPEKYIGQMYGPQKQLAQKYPLLQLLPQDYLVTSNAPFALLLCNDEDAVKIGTFELHDSVKLLSFEDHTGALHYAVAFPSYSLNIFVPEQIVVLTGI